MPSEITCERCDVAITFGDLFAGIGGMSRGLERAGMQCRWQVEIDKSATRILQKNFPDVRRYPDVKTVGGELEHVDLIAGGFPCQDLSLMSSTATGLDGERSGLWWEMLRIVRLVRPLYTLVENVAAILKRGMGEFLGSMAEAGLDAEWDCLSCKEFGGPHERDRFFALAYANKEHGEAGMGNLQIGTPPVFSGSPRQRDEFWLQTPCPRDRVDDGLPAGLYIDRVGGLGNAVSPIVAQWIGERIVDTALTTEQHLASSRVYW